MLSKHCYGYTPSTNGFQFSSDDLPSPSIRLTLNNGSQLDLNQVTRTLAGGMSFASADYYRVLQQITSGPAPSGSDALYMYLVERQLDSLDQSVIAHIIAVMSPGVPRYDGEVAQSTGLSTVGQQQLRSRASVLVLDELPRIVRDINLGNPVQLCLIEQTTADPRLLGEANRQVLCYGYDANGDDYTLHVYDPEYPTEDNAALQFTALTTRLIEITYTLPQNIAGFFYVPYSAKTPPD
jgi:hypothetical protein